MLVLIIFHVIFVRANFSYISEKNNSLAPINKIALGSCYNGLNNKNSRFDIFQKIDEHKPDLWIWLGDAAYIRPLKRTSYIQKISNFFSNKNLTFDYIGVEEKFNQTKNNTCN